jgi:hypothetical protein
MNLFSRFKKILMLKSSQKMPWGIIIITISISNLYRWRHKRNSNRCSHHSTICSKILIIRLRNSHKFNIEPYMNQLIDLQDLETIKILGYNTQLVLRVELGLIKLWSSLIKKWEETNSKIKITFIWCRLKMYMNKLQITPSQEFKHKWLRITSQQQFILKTRTNKIKPKPISKDTLKF